MDRLKVLFSITNRVACLLVVSLLVVSCANEEPQASDTARMHPVLKEQYFIYRHPKPVALNIDAKEAGRCFAHAIDALGREGVPPVWTLDSETFGNVPGYLAPTDLDLTTRLPFGGEWLTDFLNIDSAFYPNDWVYHSGQEQAFEAWVHAQPDNSISLFDAFASAIARLSS